MYTISKKFGDTAHELSRIIFPIHEKHDSTSASTNPNTYNICIVDIHILRPK